MAKWMENWFPWVGAVTTAVLVYVLVNPVSSAGMLQTLATTLVTVASISVGFLGTTLAILLSMQSKFIRQIKETPAWAGLVGFMTSALHISFLFVVVSVWFLFVDLTAGAEWKRFAVAVWSGLGAVAALASWRTISLFSLLLREDSRTKPRPAARA